MIKIRKRNIENRNIMYRKILICILIILLDLEKVIINDCIK